MASIIPPNSLHIQINAFETPSSVWATEVAHSGMSEERRDLYIVEQELSSIARRKNEPAPDLEPGSIVAVRSLHDHRLWRRGKIECMLEHMSGIKYKVLLLDEGIKVYAKPGHIRHLPHACAALPPQAIFLVLEGAVPSNLGISTNFDELKPMICGKWTPYAEEFVNNVKQIYHEAYFVEGTHPRSQGKRFGDLLLVLDHSQGLVSLKELLCEKKHAVVSYEDFNRRQIASEAHLDGPVVCCSPLHIESSSEASSSCAPSPSPSFSVKAVDKSHERTTVKKPLTIAEYQEDKNRRKFQQAEAQKLEKEKEEPSALCEEHLQPIKTLNKEQISPTTNRLVEMAKLRRSISIAPGTPSLSLPQPQPPSKSPCSPLQSSLSSSDGHINRPFETQPKTLDSRFVPAGRDNETARNPPGPQKSARAANEFYPCGGMNRSLGSSSDTEDHNSSKKSTISSDSNFSEGLNNSSTSSLKSPCSTNTQIPVHKSSGHISLNDFETIAGGVLDSSQKSLQLMNIAVLRRNNAVSQTASPAALHVDLKSKTDSSPTIPTAMPAVSSSMRDRIICSQHLALTEDGTKGEDFLARAVLCHGGFPVIPWMTINDVKHKFSPGIEQYLINKHWAHRILTIEKFMWPAIQQRQNVIMISPKKSGKTSSYIIPLMDFMIDLQEIPKGNGPLVIILCGGSKAASHIHDQCLKVVNGMKRAPRILFAAGLARLDRDFFLKMVNGCEVFISTPPCFLRLLKDYKGTYALNLCRLQHYVLDQAHVLMTRFLDEMRDIQSLVVAEQDKRMKNLDEKDPIQTIVSSEKWEPHLLSFSAHLRGNPLLCINDCFEACVYGKPEVVFHLTLSEKKLTKLLEVLRSLAGLHKIILFCDQSEIEEVEEFLKNGCFNLLVANSCRTNTQLQAILHSWDSSCDGQHYILLCTDNEFDELKCQDATCVMHYSLPQRDKTYFVKRLSAILNKLSNFFERKPSGTHPSIHLFMDETNADQLPVTVQLMQRISDRIDKKLLEAAKEAVMRKEKETKVNKLFCENLKMFGHCLKDETCPNRHVFLPELDVSDHLPRSGVVTMQVMQVHSAGHYSSRLVEYTTDNNETIEWPSVYVNLCLMMSSHFSRENETNRHIIDESTVDIGDLFAIETQEGLFQRVQVLEVLKRNKYGNPSELLLHLIDEGRHTNGKPYTLLPLPAHLQAFPPQAVDIYLCGLLPLDCDDDYGNDATHCVKKWIEEARSEKEGSQKIFQGKIMMTMRGSLWVDPLNLMEWLPNLKTHIVQKNIKQSLLELHHALENPEHLSELYKLCGREETDLLFVPSRPCVVTPKVQPKPDWAFLENDGLEDVEFICAEDVFSVFLRKKKFLPLLNKLMDDIVKENLNRRTEEIVCLSEGDLCLSKYKDEPRWYRVKILSKNDGSYTVFYVDFGDKDDVTLEDLNTIPDWAITRLPFQAIECSLAGLSSCDSDEKIYDAADGKNLLAKVCEKKDALLTGGKHYVVAVIDYSKPDEHSILNKDLLALDGVDACEEQLKFLNFEVDTSLFNRVDSSNEDFENNMEMVDPEIDLSDLEFKEEDLSGFVDEDDDSDRFGDFEICGMDSLLTGIKEQLTAAFSQVEGMPKANNKTEFVGHESKSKCSITEVTAGDEDWDEEPRYVGRFPLPDLCSARTPQITWKENLYTVWINVLITGVEKYFLQWTCNSIQFSTSIGNRLYHLDQQLRGVIYPDSMQSTVKGFSVELKMKKVCSGVLWERPFSHTRRVARDPEADVDSSDSDCEVTLNKINREVRKRPLHKRREPTKDQGVIRPDVSSDDGGSNSDFGHIDSDETLLFS